MKLVFCGTPHFAVPTLQALVEAGHDIALVVTQPDRASGRGLAAAQPAVKLAAMSAGLSVIQPEKIKNNPEFRVQLEAIAPDAIVVVAFGRVIHQHNDDTQLEGQRIERPGLLVIGFDDPPAVITCAFAAPNLPRRRFRIDDDQLHAQMRS